MSQSNPGENDVSLPPDDEQQNGESSPFKGRDDECRDAAGDWQQQQPRQTAGVYVDDGHGMHYSRHVLLSCFVFCCCGPGGFCGLAALFLALYATGSDSQQAARRFGIASIVLSILGIITGVGLTVVLLTYWQTAFDLYVEAYCPFFSWGRCYTSRRKVSSWFTCVGGDYHFTDGYCYYPSAHDDDW